MKIVCYTEPTENGLLLHYPSASVKAELLHLWEGAKENYNGYLAVDLKKPYKSRSSEQNRTFLGNGATDSKRNGERYGRY